MYRIDEEQAWQWILAARRALTRGEQGDTLRVPDPQGSATTLQLKPCGSWHLDALISPEADALLSTFMPLCAPGTQTLVIGQTGQTLDGRIASTGGQRDPVNGPDGLRHLHRLRALVDVVLVGTGTAAADNPQLTVRGVPGDNPVRAVIDRQGRLPESLRVFTDGQAATLRLMNRGVGVASTQRGVEVLPLPRSHRGAPCAPKEILACLARRGLTRVLVEGGSATLSGFLQANALTHLHVMVAPVILGSGVPSVSLNGITQFNEVLRPPCRVTPLGSDTLFAFRF